MNFLLDSHAILWALDDPSRLGNAAIAALQVAENDLFMSAGSIWELSIKVGLSKLTLSMPYRAWIEKALVADQCRTDGNASHSGIDQT